MRRTARNPFGRSHKQLRTASSGAISAFTLIELLVVIAIIALLVSILLPALRQAKDLAKRSVCASTIRGLSTAIFMYASDNNEFMPPAQTVDGQFDDVQGIGNSLRFMGWGTMIYWTYGNENDPFINLGRLYAEGLTSAEAFYCVADKRDMQFYLENSYGPAFDKMPPPHDPPTWGNRAIYCSYDYNPHSWSGVGSGPYGQSKGFIRAYYKVTDPPDRVMMMDQMKDPTRHGSDPAGFNVMFGDGHVRYTETAVADAYLGSAWDFDREGWNEILESFVK